MDMTPQRRLELLSASRLGLAILGCPADFAREGLVLVTVKSGVRRWVRPENAGGDGEKPESKKATGKKVSDKKAAGKSKRKTPVVEPTPDIVEPTPEPVVAAEPVIDYRHKDANHPVVLALRANPKAEAALKAVLSIRFPEQAELDTLKARDTQLAAAQKELYAKKRKSQKDWGRLNDVLAEQRQSAVRQIEIRSKLGGRLRDAALDALQHTLKTDDMRGVETTPLDANDVGVRSKYAMPITASKHWDAHRVAIGVAGRFVSSCLSGHRLRVSHAAMPAGGRPCCGLGSRHNVIFNEPAEKADRGGRIAMTCVHELGHAVEKQKPGVQQATEAFLKYRVGDEPLTDLAEKFGGYEPGEWGRKDNFDRVFGDNSVAYYVGKSYGATGNTELVSMGLEKLYTDPVGFAQSDPEYFQFIAHVMSMPTTPSK